MPIPESQLDIWDNQGAIQQSSLTYAAIRNVLDDPNATYHNRDYSIFLQGSYGNDTNVYAQSDVDIVIRLDSSFYRDLGELSAAQQAIYHHDNLPADYGFETFRSEVATHLIRAFGSDATPGNKAIKIAASSARRNADVVIVSSYRRYFAYRGATDQDFVEGICFWTPDGQRIVNFPGLHSKRCTSKHERTGYWFKPVVRIFKNLRNKMVADQYLAHGIAPSYFIEGMLHNVPDQFFGKSYSASFLAILQWLSTAKSTDLLCANGQHYLLRDGSDVTWREADFRTFLYAAARYWDDWYQT